MNNFTDDDWLTPPALKAPLGKFDLDPCSPIDRPWDTATKHYTINDDGLCQPWHGRVWLNPPYTAVAEWMQRMSAHQNGIALVNARTQTRWFFDCIWNSAHAAMFLKGKPKFYRPDGTKGGQGMNAIVLAAYKEADAAILYGSGLNGKFVPLIIKLQVDLRRSWRQLVRHFLNELGGTATLEQLYELCAGHPKALSNPNYEAKIRQQVQRVAKRVGPGLWQATLSLS